MSAVLRGGIDRGEIRSDLDLELAFFLIWGPVYYRYLVGFARGAPIEPDFILKLVDSMLASIGTG